MAGIGHNGPGRSNNWIAISRDVIEHHIVGAGQPVEAADRNRGSFSRLESWIDLLTLANWAERQIDNHGVVTILRPGQTLAGRAYLARRWNWTEKTVRSWLIKLERELMISMFCETAKQGHPKGHTRNVLTICNWDVYQGHAMAAGPPDSPPKGHPRATQGPEKNKGTINKEKEIGAREPSGREFWANAVSVPGGYDVNAGVELVEGKPRLINGTRQQWLEKFGGDAVALDLALDAAAAYVQPNSGRPLKTQVEAQLARVLLDSRQRDKRYATAAARNKPKSTPTGSDWSAIAKKSREQAERAK